MTNQKGVKLKRKVENDVRPNIGPPKVVSNVGNELITEDLSQDALRISFKLEESNRQLINSLKMLNKILSRKVLLENRSQSDIDEEKEIISSMTSSAREINNLSEGEGTLALSIFIIRQLILFKDFNNKLSYEVDTLNKKVLKLSGDQVVDESTKKVMDLAKQLGVSIKLGEDE